MQRRASQLTIGFDPEWKRQSAWDTPVPASELIKAFPATSRNYLDIEETVEDILDCTGQDFLFELLTARVARLNIDFDVDPDVLTGLTAFAYGVASAPVLGTNEVQTETITATGGTRTLTYAGQTTTALAYNASAATIQTALEALSNVAPGDITVGTSGANRTYTFGGALANTDVVMLVVDGALLTGGTAVMAETVKGTAASGAGTDEIQTETLTATGGDRTLTVQTGATAHTTTALPFDALAATIQAALEALPNVGVGDIVVSVAAGGADGDGPYEYTFGGALAGQDVNLITVNTFGLTGGTSTITETTSGVGTLHVITRLLTFTLPLLTFYIGFRGSDKQPVIFKNVVVNSIRVRASARGRVTASAQLIGSADLQYAVGYTMPECMDIIPIRFGDCQINIGGTDYIAANIGREFEYYYENNVVPQYDGSGVEVTRLERNDQRPSGFNLFLLGEPGDALYNVAKAKTTLPVSVRCGPAGRNITFSAPQGLVKLAPTPIRFGGDPPESEMAIVVRNKKVSGDNTTPTNVSARIAQTTALITSA